jgi:hypothetical protein
VGDEGRNQRTGKTAQREKPGTLAVFWRTGVGAAQSPRRMQTPGPVQGTSGTAQVGWGEIIEALVVFEEL